MRLQIALMNIIVLMILFHNLKFLKESQKLNTQIFRLILLTDMVVVPLEYFSFTLVDLASWTDFAVLLRAVFDIMIPVYVTLSLLFAETWVYGIRAYSKRFLALVALPIVANLVNVLVWYFWGRDRLPTLTDHLLSSWPGRIFLLCAFTPMVHTWVKLLKKRQFIDQTAFMELLIFSIPVSLAGTVQVFLPRMPLFWNGSVISLILIYFNLQNVHAFKDSLTQLGNRRELLHDWFYMKTNRSRRPVLGGILIDIDHFKTINDRFGHSVGDQVLVEVAQLLQRSRQDKDGVYRLGGDEFLVLASLDHLSDIQAIQTRIQDNLMHLNRRNLYPFDLSLSMGVLGVPLEDELELKNFLDQLDELMYKEKDRHHRVLTDAVNAQL